MSQTSPTAEEKVFETVLFIHKFYLSSVKELETKAIALAGFSSGIASIYAPFVVVIGKELGDHNSFDLWAVLSFFALSFLIASVFLSLWAITVKYYSAGPDPSEVAEDIDESESIVIKRLVRAYNSCINDNRNSLIDKGGRVEYAVKTVIGGLILLGIAVFIAFMALAM